MKENGPPQNKSTSPSTRSTDAADLDIYTDGSIEDEFDMLTSEDERPEHLPALGSDWVDARPPPGYSEIAPPTSSSSRREQPISPQPPKGPIPAASTSQFELHPLLSGSPPAQNQDQSNRNPSLGSAKPSRPTTCVICQQRPISNDGDWTCGRTCQQRLEATRQTPNGRIMEGQMSNPRPEQPAYFNSFPQNDPRPVQQIRMCEVCHLRPKCHRGGKTYPTCGLTCAAKLSPAGTVEMCDFCKKRPKAVFNGKVYPQCGKTCRDNAKMAVAAVANSATCVTCIICWRAHSAENSDFCSAVCEVAANNRAPFLIELPRGHRAFRKVTDVYVDSWKHTRNPIPRIKRVYMIQIKGSAVENYEQYRSRVNSQALLSRKKGNEQRAWLGIVRECGFGDPSNVEPCSSATCQLCCVVRSNPTNEMLTDGIYTTGSLPRAVETTKNAKRRSSRVILLANVLYGKVAEWSENLPPRLAPGYDSVHQTGFTRSGTKLDFQEILVYHRNAIRPLYLIVLES